MSFQQDSFEYRSGDTAGQMEKNDINKNKQIGKEPMTRRYSIDKWIQLINEGISIPLTTYLDGVSMEPLIRYMKDPVTIVPVNRKLIPGDVVLFRRPDGKFVLHRLYRLFESEKKAQTWGDNCARPDPIMPLSSVVGIAVSFNKNGKQYNLDSDEQRQKGLSWLNSKYRRKVWFMYKKAKRKAHNVTEKLLN